MLLTYIIYIYDKFLGLINILNNKNQTNILCTIFCSENINYKLGFYDELNLDYQVCFGKTGVKKIYLFDIRYNQELNMKVHIIF